MQELHANMGAGRPATLAGPIHRTRVLRQPQYSQQIPSTHGFWSSVWAGAGSPPRANSAIPGITIRSSTENLSSSIPHRLRVARCIVLWLWAGTVRRGGGLVVDG
ncbi:hypothetical protein GA0115259_1042413 [Streptomyces sp. MnatMP-M17]|nr:hypothetical protein GA0115259_1042413 [Streptomyces sp. MnatMP-M17]